MTLAEQIGILLKNKKMTLSVAESCTGGLVGDMITNVSGSSDYFFGGIIAYDNRIKIEVLGVDQEILDTFGAVSAETAKKMAVRVKDICKTDIGVSVTGIAGPSGGSVEKPVGLVYVGLAADGIISAKKFLWTGSRIENKQQSAQAALEMVKDYLDSLSLQETK